MKCVLCNQRNGNTRCEGCNTLFCLPCMTKHHDELVQQFQLLLDMRNEVKQSLNTHESTSLDGKEMACINEIDKWERESIQRIQKIAAKARENAKEITTKHMDKISRQFEKLSIDIQERQKQGDYLENDLEKIKTQLDQLNTDIEQVNEKIRVDSTMSDNIEWDELIYIVEKETSSKTTSESVQTKDTVTKESKKTASLSKFIKDHRTGNSSSVTRQTEQVTTKTSGPNSIPIQVLKSNSSSKPPNLISSAQRIGRPGVCDHCRRAFRDLPHMGICLDCYDRQQFFQLDV